MTPRALTIVTVILGLVSLATLIAMFLALHDISQDYASAETWTREGRTVPDWVPAWASCPLEWRVVEIGWWLLLLFHLVFFVSMIVRAQAGKPVDDDAE
jgi:hypothetical protein